VTLLSEGVKQKSQASADFLGVSAIADKVAGTVLHSDNNFDPFGSGLRTVFPHPTTQTTQYADAPESQSQDEIRKSTLQRQASKRQA
jgi:hypothetical protein